MIDHVYVLVMQNDVEEKALRVFQHRANAVFAAVKKAYDILGPDFEQCTPPDEAEGVDLLYGIKYSPAYVCLMRRVPE